MDRVEYFAEYNKILIYKTEQALLTELALSVEIAG